MTATKQPALSPRKFREAIASLSTGSGEGYYERPSEALARATSRLATIGIELQGLVSWNDKLPEYRHNFHLQTEDGESVEDTVLVFMWHIMPSGRYEITMYLS